MRYINRHYLSIYLYKFRPLKLQAVVSSVEIQLFVQLFSKLKRDDDDDDYQLSDYRLAVWLSGNTLASINVVALRQTRLVLGWVTICGRVNHLGM